MVYVGKSIKARESLAYLEGSGSYIDDLNPPDTLFLRIIRSPYANAEIKHLDLLDAKKRCPLVISSEDIKTVFENWVPVAPYPGSNMVRLPVLADNAVKFVGQPVAGIISGDRYSAEDMDDFVSVDYEPLTAVTNPIDALKTGSAIVHEKLGTNTCVNATLGSKEIESVFEDADKIVEDDMSSHRIMPNPIETRGILVRWDGSRFNIWISSQGTYRIRSGLASVLRTPEDNLHVYQTDVGGAFGSKGSTYPEYVMACYASMILKKPVKWIETRYEHLTATHHARDIRAKVKLAATSSGKILGLQAQVIADIGAYAYHLNSSNGPFVGTQLIGPYAIKSARVEVLSVYTNKTPTGPYRGAGRPEAAFFIERMVDLLAAELKIDPVDIRLRNLVRYDEMPYSTPLGITLDPEDYHAIFRSSLASYQRYKEWTIAEKRKGRLIGIGLSNYVELSRLDQGEGASVEIKPDGRILVITGLGPHGQGHSTILAQLVADELQVEMDRVDVIYGDSDLLPQGNGTFGSRSAAIGGASVIEAARKVRAEMFDKASELMAVPREGLTFDTNFIQHSHTPLKLKLEDLIRKYGELKAFVFYKSGNIISYGVHIAVAEVDRSSGRVTVIKYKAIDDAGRVLNPLLAEGQVSGGILQGIGQVLHEKMVYDNQGVPLIGSIGDAGVPSSGEAVDIETEFVEQPSNLSHGVRGIGEAGPIGAVPTLIQAIEDAIGKRMRTTHAGPESILKLLQGN
ncbi:MAG: xanthine dehydrogenase family protein molybdopterin-binding subunit [Thaumarchaeota archaeon]|nr:xanthine dehydrogenase family protein molybdopterin-binding subunit [Nitrososphaerota archaeon]